MVMPEPLDIRLEPGVLFVAFMERARSSMMSLEAPWSSNRALDRKVLRMVHFALQVQFPESCPGERQPMWSCLGGSRHNSDNRRQPLVSCSHCCRILVSGSHDHFFCGYSSRLWSLLRQLFILIIQVATSFFTVFNMSSRWTGADIPWCSRTMFWRFSHDVFCCSRAVLRGALVDFAPYLHGALTVQHQVLSYNQLEYV